MKTLTLNGVPYSVSGTEVYAYGTSILIGSYTNEILSLESNWQEKMKSHLAEYRVSLNEGTKQALKKAAEQQRA